jgi:hypothetical protein
MALKRRRMPRLSLASPNRPSHRARAIIRAPKKGLARSIQAANMQPAVRIQNVSVQNRTELPWVRSLHIEFRTAQLVRFHFSPIDVR